MTKSEYRLLAWSLLLATTLMSIFAGVKLGESEELSSFLILSRDPGPVVNWALFLISISIGCCIFVLRGIESRRWNVSIAGVLVFVGAAIVLLLFGIDGVLAMGVIGALVAPFFLRKRSGGGGV